MLLLICAVQAAPNPETTAPLPWSALPTRPAAPESPALGPDWFVVGPAGPVVFDAADRRLYALDLTAQTARALPLPAADDALRLDGGALLLRDDRSVWLVPAGTGGIVGSEPTQRIDLPALAPPGPLAQAGDRVFTVDVFGNRHPAFDLDARAPSGQPRLTPAADPALVPNPAPVRRDGLTLSGGGLTYACASACGGSLLGGWLIVEERSAGVGPMTVRRTAIHTKTQRQVDLSPGPRLYAPTQDLAVDAEGDLWWMIPGEAGLSFVEVRP